jgi:hypothetical protein
MKGCIQKRTDKDMKKVKRKVIIIREIEKPEKNSLSGFSTCHSIM